VQKRNGRTGRERDLKDGGEFADHVGNQRRKRINDVTSYNHSKAGADLYSQNDSRRACVVTQDAVEAWGHDPSAHSQEIRIARVNKVAVHLIEDLNVINILRIHSATRLFGRRRFVEGNQSFEFPPFFLDSVDGNTFIFRNLGNVLLNFYFQEIGSEGDNYAWYHRFMEIGSRGGVLPRTKTPTQLALYAASVENEDDP
jgi:hypothetical protein